MRNEYRILGETLKGREHHLEDQGVEGNKIL
jgi:hypothetical protein